MLIFKLFGGLAGAAAVAVPVSMGATATYKETALSDLQRKIIEDLKNRCYVIPTNNADTYSEAKLLICNPIHPFNSQYSEYFLYNHDGNRQKANVNKINKEKDKLKIIWEDFSAADSLSWRDHEFKVSWESWEHIREGINLKVSCHLVTLPEADGGSKWQCSGVSSLESSEEIKIPLTKFLG